MWIADECRESLARLGFSRIEDFFRAGSADVRADTRQTRILKVSDKAAGSFYVKSYVRGLGTYFLRRSKAAGEAANMTLLRRLGVRSLNMAAVGELRRRGHGDVHQQQRLHGERL